MGLKIELRSWDDDAVQWSTAVGDDGDTVEVDLDALQAFVFETLRPKLGDPGAGYEPAAYRVSLSQTREEAGAGAAWGEVVVVVREWATMLSWGVLGSMIAGYIMSRTEE